MTRVQRPIVAVIGIAAFTLALAGTRAGKLPTFQEIVRRVRVAGASYTPARADKSGNQLVMVYFGSSNCGMSTGKQLQEDLEMIKLRLEERALQSGWSFMAVGVALDLSAASGIEYLRNFGQFDQISAGYGWANMLAIKYLWIEHPGIAATPQVLVLSRRLTVPAVGENAVAYGIEGERVVARKVGLAEIQQWRDNGAALPDLDLIQLAASRGLSDTTLRTAHGSNHSGAETVRKE